MTRIDLHSKQVQPKLVKHLRFVFGAHIIYYFLKVSNTTNTYIIVYQYRSETVNLNTVNLNFALNSKISFRSVYDLIKHQRIKR